MTVTEVPTNGVFTDGGAWCGTIVSSVLFLTIGAVMTAVRAKIPHRLASYHPFVSMYNSFLPGFSFGAEILFVVGAMESNQAVLGAMVLLSRFLHFFGGLGLCYCIFGSREKVRKLDVYSDEISLLRDHLEKDFVHKNISFVALVACTTLMDASMIQFLPWKVSRLFMISEGFPTMRVMKICMTINSIQTCVSVACQVIYLGTIRHTPQAESLYSFNIMFGIITVVMYHLILSLRGDSLYAEETREDYDREVRQSEALGKMDSLELSSVYASSDSGKGGVDVYAANPMHGGTSVPL